MAIEWKDVKRNVRDLIMDERVDKNYEVLQQL
jgi:hypothetical protein